MEESGVEFDGEDSGVGGDLDLIDEAGVAPGKEAILRGGVGGIPAELPDVVVPCESGIWLMASPMLRKQASAFSV